MTNIQLLELELEKGRGVIRLTPTWVPRSFLIPGRRLKLYYKDVYALGAERGGIDERWLASTTHADNGSNTPSDEGMSYISLDDFGKRKMLLSEAIDQNGIRILGTETMKNFGGWMMFSKFFDNLGPIPHHVHLMDEHAKKVGKLGKPEAYYFPAQQNPIDNLFPHTYFGLTPGVTKEQVAECLHMWKKGDNKILNISQAYRLEPGTGWDVPPGVLHAPGSLLTYEPQRASDVYSMFQSMVEGRYVSRDLLTKDIPLEFHNNYDYLVSILDWEKNVDPDFCKNRFRPPIPVYEKEEAKELGYNEKWIVYGRKEFSAKELTIPPGKTVIVHDIAAYGLILMEGYGSINGRRLETPVMIYYGQMTDDEMFVTRDAAVNGVTITNESNHSNLVMLKHFGPEI